MYINLILEEGLWWSLPSYLLCSWAAIRAGKVQNRRSRLGEETLLWNYLWNFQMGYLDTLQIVNLIKMDAGCLRRIINLFNF